MGGYGVVIFIYYFYIYLNMVYLVMFRRYKALPDGHTDKQTDKSKSNQVTPRIAQSNMHFLLHKTYKCL